VEGQVRQQRRSPDFGLRRTGEVSVGQAQRAMIGIDRRLALRACRRLAVVAVLVAQLALLREQQEKGEDQSPVELTHDQKASQAYGATIARPPNGELVTNRRANISRRTATGELPMPENRRPPLTDRQ
jgi:hypothetical protein